MLSAGAWAAITAAGSFAANKLWPDKGADISTGQGDRLNQFGAAQFPGTNPWERLGAGGAQAGAAITSSNVQAKTQRNQQRTAITTAGIAATSAANVASIQAKAHVQGAEIAADPQHQKRTLVEVPKVEQDVKHSKQKVLESQQTVLESKQRVKESGAKELLALRHEKLASSQILQLAAQTDLTRTQVQEVLSKISNVDQDTLLKILHQIQVMEQTRETAARANITEFVDSWKLAFALTGGGAALNLGKMGGSLGTVLKYIQTTPVYKFLTKFATGKSKTNPYVPRPSPGKVGKPYRDPKGWGNQFKR